MNTPYYFNNDTDTPFMPFPPQEENHYVEQTSDIPLMDNPESYEDASMDSDMENHVPVNQLPNPGEGGIIDSNLDYDYSVVPPSNPNEEGPLGPGPVIPDYNIPNYPFPNPDEGGPYPGEGGPGPVIPDYNIPISPLPNPSEGGTITPIPMGSIITVYPRPVNPCFFCTSNRYGNVRFLNAATGYNSFLIYVNNQLVVNALDYAQVSQYGRVTTGYQTITVSGMNGYIYIQKQVQITNGSTMTIAIINTANGLDLTQISDVPCSTPRNSACFRACNLSYNSGPLDVVLENRAAVFTDVQFQEVTDFVRVSPGTYSLSVSRTSMRPTPRLILAQPLVTSLVNIRSNTLYTAYIFNWNSSPDAIRIMVVEDRK